MTDTLANDGFAIDGGGILDPVTFEILRSRLSAINDEAAMTMRLVSRVAGGERGLRHERGPHGCRR